MSSIFFIASRNRKRAAVGFSVPAGFLIPCLPLLLTNGFRGALECLPRLGIDCLSFEVEIVVVLPPGDVIVFRIRGALLPVCGRAHPPALGEATEAPGSRLDSSRTWPIISRP